MEVTSIAKLAAYRRRGWPNDGVWIKEYEPRLQDVGALNMLYVANFAESTRDTVRNSEIVHYKITYKCVKRALVVKVEMMRSRHFLMLLAIIRTIANNTRESFGCRSQSINSAATDFRHFENFRTRILLFCGALVPYIYKAVEEPNKRN